MCNIIHLFLEDLKALKLNVIAGIVAMGLVLVPSLYAWFNLLAFWDPEARLNHVAVAVASEDIGYEGSLIPMKLDAGLEIENALREHADFDWIFTDKNAAVDGVRSGRYFAAIVIPEHFTQNLLSVFSGSPQKAEIDYYVNQKANAVVSELTQEGVSELQQSLSREFAQIMAEAALGTTSNLMAYFDGSDIARFGDQLLVQLDEVMRNLAEAQSSTQTFTGLANACSDLLEATAQSLDETEALSKTVAPLLSDAQEGIDEGAAALTSVVDLAEEALSKAETALDALGTSARNALKGFEGTQSAAQKALHDNASDIASQIQALKRLQNALQNVEDAQRLTTSIESVVALLGSVESDLNQAANDIGKATTVAEADEQSIQSSIDKAKNALKRLHTDMVRSLNHEAEALSERITSIKDQALLVSEDVSSEAETLSRTATTLAEELDHVHETLEATTTSLESLNTRLSTIRESLKKALASGDLTQVRAIIGNDPIAAAAHLAAPTKLNRHEIFSMANNGSAMAPFYLSLALWIGAIFEVALMETTVSDARRRTVEEMSGRPLTPGQCYWGRYLIFCSLSLCQATILILGAILFLQIQCEHPWLILASGWIAAVVFSNIIYTLVLSFGRVGEAICVIGLVAQIAGSGGVFPVALSGPLFEAIYPWLPFSHSMEAFESCIAGIYDGQLLTSLGLLAALILPSLFLGLGLRRPVMRLNEFIDKELEQSGLIFKE